MMSPNAADGHTPNPLSRLIRTEIERIANDVAWSLVRRGQALLRASYVHPRSRLVGAQHLSLAGHCQVYAGATLSATRPRSPRSNYSLTIGRFTIIREYAYIDTHGGAIEIDSGVFIGQGAIIYGQGGVRIGANTLLAPGVTVAAAQHIFEPGRPIKFQPESMKGISIGSDCWLGANVVVLDGVFIGDGTVVGAGAVVTRDLPPHSVATGNPARVRRSR